jgi:hypothetical protein
MGIFLILTWVLSIGAIVQPNHSTLGLKILNLMLVVDAVVVTTIGSFIWFYSLQQRNNYYEVFKSVPDSTKLALQNQVRRHTAPRRPRPLTAAPAVQFSCCGYFAGNDTLTVGGFCKDATFASLNTTTPCVGPITAATDYTLNNIFSSVYGFGAVVTALFVASLCVINMVRCMPAARHARRTLTRGALQRVEEERFKKIDSKRGGRGFA